MKQFCAVLLVGAGLLTPALSEKGGSPFAGRWDITVTAGNASYPDWMEFVEKDSKPEVRYQPRGGSVRPVKDVRMEGSHLILTLNPGAIWDLTVDGNRLTGVQKRNE